MMFDDMRSTLRRLAGSKKRFPLSKDSKEIFQEYRVCESNEAKDRGEMQESWCTAVCCKPLLVQQGGWVGQG